MSVVFEPAQSQEAQRSIQSPAVSTIASVSKSFLNESSDSQQTAIQNETVNYYNNHSGYLVYPISNQNQNQNSTTNASATTQAKLPGIIMIHENRGLNENIKDSADILARQGYVVLAVDLFGEVAADPDRAR